MEQAMHNEQKKEQKSLPFFGIPRLFPYLKKYRKTLTFMVICGLLATGVDILMPVLQRYALNHFIAEKSLDTLPWYILIYVALIIFASCVNFVSCNGAMKTGRRLLTTCRPCPSPTSTRTASAGSIPGSCPTPPGSGASCPGP